MTALTTKLSHDGETLTIDHMGGGFVMLSQEDDGKRAHRVGYDLHRLSDALLQMIADEAAQIKTALSR